MIRVLSKSAALFALATMVAAPAFAQDQAAPVTPVLAKTLAPARSGAARLLVTSTSFIAGDSIPDQFTQNGENMSPTLRWAKGPAGTLSYVVLVEDSGVSRAEPIVHWVVYDIPGTMTTLPAGIGKDPTLESGAMQGKNIRGEIGYIGPKPPAGQTHPYHFQVFALNGRVRLEPGADRNAVVAAMKGKVIALGDLIVNYTGK
jgi:Raf kinase inhibitor-like YbhB/YbcL family protein